MVKQLDVSGKCSSRRRERGKEEGEAPARARVALLEYKRVDLNLFYLYIYYIIEKIRHTSENAFLWMHGEPSGEGCENSPRPDKQGLLAMGENSDVHRRAPSAGIRKVFDGKGKKRKSQGN